MLEADPRVHVSCSPGERALRRVGVVGSERSGGQAVLTKAGLRVVSPLDCWRDLARMLEMPDLVAAGDYLVTRTRRAAALTTVDALRAISAETSGRGCVTMRRAATLVRGGPRSRAESLLRVALVVAGVEEPLVNPELRLPTRVAHPDLYWDRFKVGVEYQGEYHADPKQWARDVRRAEDLTDAGVDLLQFLAADLFGATRRTVARVALRLQSRGWTPPQGFDPAKTVRLRP